nr:unnamed protein product [Callosobruchus analis]
MAQFLNIRRRKSYCQRTECRDEDYHNLYRFCRSNVLEWLAEHFLEDTAETRGGALNSRQKMQIFLRFLSDPSYQTGVGKDEGVHRTTVSKTVKFVLTKIIQKWHVWLNFPIINITEAQQGWSANISFLVHLALYRLYTY